MSYIHKIKNALLHSPLFFIPERPLYNIYTHKKYYDYQVFICIKRLKNAFKSLVDNKKHADFNNIPLLSRF